MNYPYIIGHYSVSVMRIVCGCLLTLILLTTVEAQSSWSATTGTTPTSMAPGAPPGSYSLSGFESVSLFDRRINFDLPLLHIGGRGAAGFTIQMPLQVQWQESHFGYPTGCGQGGCSGWNDVVVPTPNSWKMQPIFSPGVVFGRQAVDGKTDVIGDQGQIVCTYYTASLTRLTFSAADGTEYELRDTAYDGQPQATTCQTAANRGRVFVSKDGSGMTFYSDNDIWDQTSFVNGAFYPSGYLLFKDGTRYRISGGNVAWIRDRNGNQINFDVNGNGQSVITDSLGRTVTITNTGNGFVGYYEIAFTGVGGGVTRYIRVYYDNLHNLLTAGSTQTYSQLFPYLPNASTQNTFDPGSILSAVVLPDGRQYSFKYNAYAELSRIDLPTGGRIEYDYQQPETNSVHHYVSERRVFTDAGITQETKTQYFGDGTLDHLTPGGALLSREKHYFYGLPYGESLFNNHPTDYSNWSNGREYLTEFYAADGVTLLRSTAQTWQQRTPLTWCQSCQNQPPNDPDVVTTVSTLADVSPNLVTKTTSINPQTGVPGFDQFNNPTDAWEYDYGNGAPSTYPVRHTHTDYLTTNPVNGIDYTAYTGAHIRSLPTAHNIYSVNPTNGAETLMAQSATAYDETNSYPLLTYASVTGWTDPGTAARGNATTSSHWLNTSNSWLATHAQYDQLGNVRSVWDANGNQTQISYVDSFSDGINRNTYALATSMTSPVPDPTGVYGLSTPLSVSTIYDFSTGAVISGTDANGQTASFQYNDLLDRPTQLRQAVGTTLTNQSTITYDDANHIITTTSDLITNNDNALKGQVIYDGLGRTIETRAYENSTQYITVKKIPYVPLQDPDTGVWVAAAQSSNPYRSYLGEQAVWTTSFSDALGRTTKVRTPDNAIARTSYSGNTVTASDQTGKSRKSVTNALLVQVYEDPAGLNYLTSYAYDALGNLTTITQGSQTRSSVYDSLKRVLSTTNPENGTISFQYDNDGNVTQRTDARQPAVTTTYGYDNINRPITRTYSDGTPGVAYKYDSASGVSNAKGRTVSVSSSVSTSSFSGYDALGRVTGGSQTLGSQTYSMSYNYDLAGHVLSEKYPSSDHMVSNSFDAAGRLSSVTGTLGDNTNRAYSAGISYSSLGGLTQEQFGTDMPVYNKLFYNVRGQLSEIRESTTPNDTSWDRGAIINYYSGQCWGMCGGSNSTTAMADNNGNLKAQQVYIPGGTTWWQAYDYDNLNRLQRVHEHTDTQTLWQQEYVYDRYGNRTIDQTNTWGANIPKPDFGVTPSNNRLTAPAGYTMSYDAAGNLTNDTYTGAGSRAYDAENRLTIAWGGNNQSQAYAYDGNGQRVKRVVNGVETWQVYGMRGELLAEYAANSAASTPQKEYAYRNGQLLVTVTGGTGGGAPPVLHDNPLNPNYVGETTVQSRHITELRDAINGLRANLGMSGYSWQTSATTNDWIKADPILEMRTALDQALGAPSGGYSAGLAQGQPIKAIHIQELRDRVLAAWSSSSALQITWLVTDQLGTPRMIFDKTGILANTKRHDYLPFGEELTNQGLRPTTPGYNVADGIRQKFTSQERDNETGLDYMHARYFASAQGRFTSADSFGGSIGNPQSLNRYTYVVNNPMNLSDPTGHEGLYNAHSNSTSWMHHTEGSLMLGGQLEIDAAMADYEKDNQKVWDDEHGEGDQDSASPGEDDSSGSSEGGEPQNSGVTVPTDANDLAVFAVLLGEASTPGEGSWGPDDFGRNAYKHPTRTVTDDDVYGEMSYMVAVINNRLLDWGAREKYKSWSDVIEKSPDFVGYSGGKDIVKSLGSNPTQENRARIALAAIKDFHAAPFGHDPSRPIFHYWKGIKQNGQGNIPYITQKGNAFRIANTDFSVNNNRY